MTESKISFWEHDCGGTPRDRRNHRRIKIWLMGWMGSWLALTALVKFELLAPGALASAAAVASGLVGLGALLAYRRFLWEADELRRKIELEAMAAALGVGVVGGLTSWLLVHTGALVSVDVLWVVMAMLVAQGLGSYLGYRRYA